MPQQKEIIAQGPNVTNEMQSDIVSFELCTCRPMLRVQVCIHNLLCSLYPWHYLTSTVRPLLISIEGQVLMTEVHLEVIMNLERWSYTVLFDMLAQYTM